MNEIPKQQPPKRGSNGFWIGATCLVVGYLLGQSLSNAQKPAYAETASPSPPPLAQLTNTATSDADLALAAADMNATETDETLTTEEPDDASSDDTVPRTSGMDYQTADAGQPSTEGDEADQQASLADTSSSETQTAPTVTAGTMTASGLTSYSTGSATTTYASPGYSYSPSSGYSGSSSKCEGLSCYGTISNVTGLPRTTYVHGYFRKSGTYVQPYYRSHRH